MTRISISITDDKAVERLQWLSDRRELSFAGAVGQALKEVVEREQKIDEQDAERRRRVAKKLMESA